MLTLRAPAGVWVDASAFETAAAAARRAAAVADYEAALALYGGDLLPDDPYEEWLTGRRDALRALFVGLLVDLAALHEAAQRPEAAVEALRRAVAAEPSHEAAHAALMRLYARTGQRHEALRQYERLRRALRTELDAAPSAGSQRLVRDILTDGGDVSATPAPSPAELPGGGARALRDDARTGDAAPTDRDAGVRRLGAPAPDRHRLPHPLTTFVGRARELDDLRRLLEAPGGPRLLTLTGPGGVGKTRLALQAAREALERAPAAYPEGVCLVDLAPVRDAGLVPQTVAAAVGVREEPDRELLATLTNALRPRRLLLVVDNCEHLVEACARLAEALLQACPGLRILATSRELLGVAGETARRVPSLRLPDPSRLRRPPPAEALRGYEAVRLFVDRAQAVQSSFRLTEQNAPAVARICAQLDGIPLAIELAAGRLPALSAEQLAARLEDRFRLLTGGSRTALPRHQTLRAAVDWSHALLREPERVVFRRLAVFAGGWTLEAAEAVCAGGAIEAPAVVDLLTQLVAKSLVLAEEHGGAVRYRLLETLRQYAHGQLDDAGEGPGVRARHLTWYLALAERAAPELRGPQQVAWLDRLEAELDNVRVLLDWSTREGRRSGGGAGPGGGAGLVLVRPGVPQRGPRLAGGVPAAGRRPRPAGRARGQSAPRGRVPRVPAARRARDAGVRGAEPRPVAAGRRPAGRGHGAEPPRPQSGVPRDLPGAGRPARDRRRAARHRQRGPVDGGSGVGGGRERGESGPLPGARGHLGHRDGPVPGGVGRQASAGPRARGHGLGGAPGALPAVRQR